MVGLKIVFWPAILLLCLSLTLTRAEESGPFAPEWFEQGRRELAVILTDEGYYPRSLSVFKGEKIRFYLTNTAREDRCFMIQQKNIFLPVKTGELRSIVVEFEREEELSFHCPVGNMKGSITVLEHPAERRDRMAKREVASQKKSKIWMPRDDQSKPDLGAR